MNRRPTPHLTRKRTRPHVGYVWRWVEDDETSRDWRVKDYHWRPKARTYEQHKERQRLGLNKAQYSALLEHRRIEDAKARAAFVDYLEQFAADIPVVNHQRVRLMSTRSLLDRYSSQYNVR